jgi:hypothetical protein
MSVVYRLLVNMDMPEDTDVHVVESIVATAVSSAALNAGLSGNVMAQFIAIVTDTSVAEFNSYAPAPIPVASNGVSTAPGAQNNKPPKQMPPGAKGNGPPDTHPVPPPFVSSQT